MLFEEDEDKEARHDEYGDGGIRRDGVGDDALREL
jgi:hypothetical protein